MNKLYFGDNLEVLREKIPDNYVDLIYLDPPFQSGKNYNIIFAPQTNNVKGATAQIQAFEDTWQWGEEAEKEYFGLIQGTITKERPNQKLIELIKAMRDYLGESSMMAYLTMMAPRLLEMKRILKETGSIYLHCNPTASHYLKLLMDAIFGVSNFRNEIVWCYKGPSRAKDDFPHKHDTILRYSKGEKPYFNPNAIKIPYSESFLERRKYVEGKAGIYKGKYVREKEEFEKYGQGKIPEDWWNDIPSGGQISRNELIGYPTQKPEKLLNRIIKASSKEGDLVLDPFCGCGTAVAVAQKLNRNWIGIDITYLAIDIIKKRLEKSDFKEGKDFIIEGAPADEYSAIKLAESNPFQFQYWAISKITGGVTNERKTGDEGVDGFINIIDPSKKNNAGLAIISVKGTKVVNPSMIRDLTGTIKSKGADFGILITLVDPTPGMIKEAVSAGYYKLRNMEIPVIQMISVKDLFKDPLPLKLPLTNIIPAYKSMKMIKPDEAELEFKEEE